MRPPAPAPAATWTPPSQQAPALAPQEDALAERVDRLEADLAALASQVAELRAALASSAAARPPGRRDVRRGVDRAVRAQEVRQAGFVGRVALVAPVGLAGQGAHGVVHVRVVDQPFLAVLQLWIIEYEQSHEEGVRPPGSGTSRIMIRLVPPGDPGAARGDHDLGARLQPGEVARALQRGVDQLVDGVGEVHPRA